MKTKNKIKELQGQVRLFERSINESITVLLMAMDGNESDPRQMYCCISVVIGNLLATMDMAGINDETNN